MRLQYRETTNIPTMDHEGWQQSGSSHHHVGQEAEALDMPGDGQSNHQLILPSEAQGHIDTPKE